MQAVDAGLAKITPSMDQAARSLGHTPAQTLWRVHLPLLRGPLLTAGLLVFIDVMKELPATLVLRPFNSDTLAVVAYNLARDERLAEAALAKVDKKAKKAGKKKNRPLATIPGQKDKKKR